MKSFLIACSSLLLAAVVLPAADSAAKPGEAPKPNPPEKRELLSKHDTVAEFVKTEDSPCRFKTSLCPDQCDHGGKVAVFKIIRYLDYQKPGQYGDAKADTFTFFIEDKHGNPKVPAAILTAVKGLKAGDKVRLAWNHDYVDREGSKFPDRPVTRLEALKPGEDPAAVKP